ncbi:hypothetical protein Lalb_Chr17g0338931 [Lupinus albus]|uniref:Uncharacterized protein n=1 Tax=Lupinus albus TaxID=3870 RepID=A0A6A4P200_LUPAL|nr:hypothetical protein Lalb_Chr17g0338931 [Lupinus albus]
MVLIPSLLRNRPPNLDIRNPKPMVIGLKDFSTFLTIKCSGDSKKVVRPKIGARQR